MSEIHKINIIDLDSLIHQIGYDKESSEEPIFIDLKSFLEYEFISYDVIPEKNDENHYFIHNIVDV
jgi:hypothetical protein